VAVVVIPSRWAVLMISAQSPVRSLSEQIFLRTLSFRMSAESPDSESRPASLKRRRTSKGVVRDRLARKWISEGE